jgi:hypothetical protein
LEGDLQTGGSSDQGCDRCREGGQRHKPSEAVLAFIEGRAKAKDVTALTYWFKDVVTEVFPVGSVAPGTDDHFFRELLVKVWNMLLLRLQDAHLSEKELEEMGSALRRVWIIYSKYRLRKQDYTLVQWLDKLKQAAEEVGVSII